MKGKKRGIGVIPIVIWTVLLCIFCPMPAGSGMVAAALRTEKLTFFAGDPLQYGLWAYDPATNQRELVSAEITEHYQISPDGRYLAFLANNLDRGKNLSNTLSLWVRDFRTKKEVAVMSDFDTDNNLDGEFIWTENGELILEQRTLDGEKRLTVFKPDGELIWVSPEEYRYICHNRLMIILQNRLEKSLVAFHLRNRQWQPLPRPETMLNPSLSSTGTYIGYRISGGIEVLNLLTGETQTVDTGEMADIKLGWSPDDRYLVYQSSNKENSELFRLTAVRLETGARELEVTSLQEIAYSWSGDSRQMVFTTYRNNWNIMIWLPEQANTISIHTGLKDRPRPQYRTDTHEFVYLDRIDESPVIFSYHVDLNSLRLLQIGPAGGSWTNLSWTPLESQPGSPAFSLKYAGVGEFSNIAYLQSFQTGKRPVSDGDLQKAAYMLLKWAPNHRTLLYRSSEQSLTLFDPRGEEKHVTLNTAIGEPFWSPDGALIGAVSETEQQRELVLYQIFRSEITRSILPAGKWKMVQWMNQRVWLMEDRLMRYFPMNGEWDYHPGWKDYWWPLPQAEQAHILADSLWQLGANIWLHTRDGRFRVLTRLSESGPGGWQAEANEFPRWSPNDDRILYHKRLVRRSGSRTETRWQVWLTDRTGATHQYLCDGSFAQWLGNYQFLFLQNGDLWLANLVTGQMVQLRTPELQELAFMVSYDNTMLAVAARDQAEKVGIYLYDLQ